MTIIEYSAPADGPSWTKEWEEGAINALAADLGLSIPERPLGTSPPEPGEQSAAYYSCYASVAGLDEFIFQSCAQGISLVDDVEFQLLLTRQVGDDGSHAQRYREVVAKGTGIDPLPAINAAAAHQRELVGDLTGQGLVGFLAFEISYELYTAPEFLILGRTANVSDPDLLVSGAERFGPDEFVHRQGVADWLRTYLRSLAPAAAAEFVAQLRQVDEELWQRRGPDIDRRWTVAAEATQADYATVRALREPWREEVHAFLFSE
jgi:hypothetical protein